jgi:hypothetical protein
MNLTQAEKKERAIRILNEAASNDAPRTKQGGLREIYHQAAPDLTPSVFLLVFFALLMPLLCAAYLKMTGTLSTAQLRAGDLIPMALICGGVILLWHQTYLIVERQKIARFAQSLVRPYEELKRVQMHVTEYLGALDNRTRRYFHCVTNTKVMSYFLLMQMSNALTERIAVLEELFAHPLPENYLAAFAELRNDLVLSSDVLNQSKEEQRLPLRRAQQAIDVLIEDLERGLNTLEREIDSTRSSAFEDA